MSAGQHHPSALIDPRARLDEGVTVGPYSIIGADVEIGADTVIGPHVVISGPTIIGRRNRFFQFCSIGEECQDKKYRGEPTRLTIADDNIFREACSVHRGTIQDAGETRIGSRNLFMVNTHIAHDCRIGDDNITANNVGLAGHVHIGDGVILGGMVGVHQFVRIGSYAMAAGGAILFKDVPAFVMVSGHPAVARGMNFEGMRRRGYDHATIQALRQAYRIVYRQGATLEQALPELQALAAQYPQVGWFMDSLQASQRGIAR